MTSRAAIQAAVEAADSALLLQTPSDAVRAAKAWSRSPVLGLDTEFVRERTYHARLGLVQISDGVSVWLLDPLVTGTREPLRELLDNPEITKIFHSPSEDLEVLGHAVGSVPDPLVDTQAACALLGQSLQMGYHATVEWLFGITIDKEQTRSNWCARPLRRAQLHYAALDVCLLPMLWDLLRSRLQDLGRLDWLEEDCQRQLTRARNPVPACELWQRIRGAGKLDGASLAILQILAEWREGEARRLNRPRGFIIPDPILLAIARGKLRTVSDLEGLENLYPKAIKRWGADICRQVEHSLDEGRTLETLKTLNNAQRRKLEKMRRYVLDQARKLEIEPAVLASKRELEELLLARGNRAIPDRLDGWRRDVITHELLNMIGDG